MTRNDSNNAFASPAASSTYLSRLALGLRQARTGATIAASAALMAVLVNSQGFAQTQETASGAKQAKPLPGFSQIAFDAAHHDKPMSGVIWYPVGEEAASRAEANLTLIADNPVWRGVLAHQDAPMASGRHPLVFISHGMGGHPYSLSWLASRLTTLGAIVVGVAHPNSTWRDFDMQKGLNHWSRAQDVSATLDWALSHETYGDHIDADSIHVAGFSYGGWTALSVGGLRGNLAWYVDHCEKEGERSSHCTDIQNSGADWSLIDEARWNADYKDERVKSVAAIDPGLTFGLSESDAQSLVENTLLIGLGRGEDRLYATDYSESGSGFHKHVPEATILNIEPANHYTAFLTCKPAGPAILEEENDDPVCSDPANTDRGMVHQAMAAAIAQHFGLTEL